MDFELHTGAFLQKYSSAYLHIGYEPLFERAQVLTS